MKLLSIFITCLFAFITFEKNYSQGITYDFDIAWSELNSGVNTPLNSVSIEDVHTVWICGDNAVVLRTNDEGAHWTNVGANGIPTNVNLMNIVMLNPNTAITSGNIGNTAYVYRTENGGINWTQVFSQADGRINGIFEVTPNGAFMVGNPVAGRWSIWKSDDFGVTWDSTGLFLLQNNNETGFNNSLYGFQSYPSYKIWFGTNNFRIYYSGDLGLHWESQTMPEQNIYSISFFGMNILAGGNNLYASSNYGNPWLQENSIGSGNINSIHPPGIIIITPIPRDNLFYPNMPWFYTRQNNKIFYTDNGPQNWQVEYESPSGNYNQLNGFSNVWGVKDNGGITKGKIDVLTSVIPDNYPYSFELKQNFPNPFNPKTKIPIAVHKATKITLNIYDSSGKLVTQIQEDLDILPIHDNTEYLYLPYNIEWDGTNYPSGVYYYQVIADDYKDTRKMVLVK